MIPLHRLAIVCLGACQAVSPTPKPHESAAITQGQADAEFDRRAVVERNNAIARRARIKEELMQPGVPAWAGEYSVSRGGLTLTVAPQSGITIRKSTDVVGTDRWNHGAIVASGERWIEIELVLPHETLLSYDNDVPVSCTARRLHLVSYGERDFIVPEHRLIALCNVFNGRTGNSRSTELRASFLSKQSPQRPDATSDRFEGLEGLPPGMRRYLLDHNVKGAVVSVGATIPCGEYAGGHPKFETAIVVDVGAKDGLLPGMALFLADPPHRREGRIIDVAESSARVAFRHGGNNTESVSPIGIGTRVYSRLD